MGPLLRRFWAHVRTLWPRYPLLAPSPFVLWGFYTFLIGERRWEIVAFMTIPVILAYTSRWTKTLLVVLYPIFLVGTLYDAMRFVQNLGLSPSRIHGCDLYALEQQLFGLPLASAGGARVAPSDWFQAHANAPLDFLCAIPYGTFLYVFIAYAIFLYFTDVPAVSRFTWTFLVLNLAGFLTYHVFPAAPPWYVHRFGCVADLTAAASEGPNLARVDGALGFPYFASFYGRSHDVFGALPSLHVAYPLVMVLEGWKRHRSLGRLATGSFFAVMVFAAVYLDHHWVLDVLFGILYTLVTYFTVKYCLQRRAEAAASALPAPSMTPSP